MDTILGKIHLASLLFIAGVTFLIIGMLSDDISTGQAFEYLWQLGVACGAIGYVRNGAGHGVGK